MVPPVRYGAGIAIDDAIGLPVFTVIALFGLMLPSISVTSGRSASLP